MSEAGEGENPNRVYEQAISMMRGQRTFGDVAKATGLSRTEVLALNISLSRGLSHEKSLKVGHAVTNEIKKRIEDGRKEGRLVAVGLPGNEVSKIVDNIEAEESE